MGSMETQTLKRYEQYVNPALVRIFHLMGLTAVESHSDGMYIFDQNGQAYLDCLGGYGVFGLGHSHPEVLQAVKDQLNRMALSGKILLNDKMAELCELLAMIMPGMQYSFVVNSGTEAVEGALKLARIYTGKTKIIAMNNAFHGKTFGALSATGRDLFRQPFEPLVPGFYHVEFDDISALEKLIDKDTAAVIIEPVQGEGGIIVPQAGYLKAVQELCKENKALLICDEVQTGFGRTGKMFAVEYDGIMPDIMITAKALGGGIMPIGAFSARAEVWEPYLKYPFIHTSTFGGNPLACAAGVVAIKVLQRDYEKFSVAKKGEIFIEGLRLLQAQYPQLIQAVRGRGLMIGIALTTEAIGAFLMAACIDEHILIAYTLNNPRVIRLEPPFLISEIEIKRVLAVFSRSLARAENIFKER